MSVTELLARYDELAMAGSAPPAEAYARAHPEHPSLLGRLHELDRLRRDLDKLASPTKPALPRPSLPGFRLLRELGRGGMGVVWAAEQASPHRLCAVKVIDATLPLARHRFRREADVAARLSHPGVATVYSVAMEGDPPYLVTEFVHGFSLRQLLAVADVVAPEDPSQWLSEALRRVAEGDATEAPSRGGPVELMLGLGLQIADALGHAHERGVVHRDVKPSNVMVGFDGRVKVIDFGIALPFAELDDRLTHEGDFVGSYSYAAPEQLRGDPTAVGPWTDTYALGATLYEMLTQRTPFDGLSYTERLAKADMPPAHGPRAYNAKVPLAVDALVMRALHPDPRRRFQDGDAMAAGLRRVTGSSQLFAILPTPRLVPRTRMGAWAMAATLLALLFAGLYLGARLDAAQLRGDGNDERARIERAVFDHVVQGGRPRLAGCINYLPVGEPPRVVADLTIAQGTVQNASLTAESRQLTAPAARCLTDVLRRLQVPGVGLAAPARFHVDLVVDPAIDPE